jgi:hypothetical protein
MDAGKGHRDRVCGQAMPAVCVCVCVWVGGCLGVCGDEGCVTGYATSYIEDTF